MQQRKRRRRRRRRKQCRCCRWNTFLRALKMAFWYEIIISYCCTYIYIYMNDRESAAALSFAAAALSFAAAAWSASES
jgi:hypothetical protein